jgi:hypothetical protein
MGRLSTTMRVWILPGISVEACGILSAYFDGMIKHHDGIDATNLPSRAIDFSSKSGFVLLHHVV